MRHAVIALFFALALAACGRGTTVVPPTPAEAEANTTPPGTPTGATPTDANRCIPAATNDEGVGATCTAGGDTCKQSDAPLCSADVAPNLGSFCTKACDDNAACGDDAVCTLVTADAKTRLCVPTSCVQAPTAPQNDCIDPTGNEEGIGRACAPLGPDCLCTTGPRMRGWPYPNVAFCSKPCRPNRANTCGQGARCMAVPRLGGVCVLNACNL